MNNQSSWSDFLQILVNLSGAFPAIFAFLIVLIAAIGVVLFCQGIYAFYVINNNDGRTPTGRTVSYTGAVSSLLTGALLTSLLYITAVTKNTLLGTEVNNGALGLNGSGMTATQQAAIAAIFGLFAILGLLASGRGWMLLNRYYNGVEKEWGGAIAYVIGGCLCIYMEEFLAKMSLWTGFDFVKIFIF
ncbi:hypothetical protein [Cupriavidus pampae]|jgi:hypothetical protein|uniref:DUF350 domain-containing protein n=1 Tax=Cupriavidus pampae TaxID=659251 RepID=A0ABN7ZDZ9_9BURK|nr:hypothetical protein [Cupriavidus pampae]CAG9184198.1 hypothetical protein LMG32289_05555 [Cupriavidus pampae]